MIKWRAIPLLLCLGFGRFSAPAIEQNIPLPATLNGQSVGDLNATVQDNQVRALDIAPIRAPLRELLSPERYRQLPTNTAALVPTAALQAAGIQVRFSLQNLTIDLTIPAEMKRAQSLDLLGPPSLAGPNPVLPAGFSAYMNLRGGVNYVESSRVNTSGFGEPLLLFENAFNYQRWVVESETALNPAPDKTWEKRDTRLIFDDPEHRIRYTAGDLNYPVAALQGFFPMLGLSLARENSLQRYRITSPLGQSAFFLKQDSKVEVIINGNTVQTLQLSAGPQQLKNFPLTGGANDVKLRITDAAGRVEYINATFLYDAGLLKAGESEFSYAVGVPSITDPDGPFYQYADSPAVSTFHRWGVSDRLTLGLNAQATDDTQLAGGEAVFSLLAGTFNLSAVFSHDRVLGVGSQQQIQYHYYAPSRGPFADGVVSVSAQHLDSAYTPITPFIPAVPHGDIWNMQAQYSQRLSDYFSAGVGYSQAWDDSSTRLGTANLLLGFNHGRIAADVSLNHNTGLDRLTEWSAFLTVRINLGPRQAVVASYDSSLSSSRTEWQYIPRDNFDSVDTTLGVQTYPQGSDFYGNFLYSGRRMELGFDQNSFTAGEHTANLHWGTALVYADGQFGVSRPILDSFAIVQSAGRLHTDGGVGVDSQGGRFQAQEDFFGPAVLPQLNSYYPVRVVVEPRKAEADFDPKEGEFTLRPTYRSGSVVRVGRNATINALARLKWPDGKPAALQILNVTGADGPTTEAVTDRAGNAYFSELSAGKYTAMISDYPETKFDFTIPTTNERQVDLGEIKVPAKP